MILVDRNIWLRHIDSAGFLSELDEESNELVQIGRALFNDNATVRYAQLKTDLMAENHGSKSGFLYIETFTLLERFTRDTDVASQAIAKLLTATSLTRRWAVAAYMGEGRTQSSHQEPFDEAAEAAKWCQAVAKDCRPFMRIHFNEIGGSVNEGWLYTTPPMLSLDFLSHDEAIRLPLRATNRLEALNSNPQTDPEAQQLDSQLLNAMQNAAPDSLELLIAEIDQLIAAGASIDRAFALHFAAATRNPELVSALAQLTADINSLDGQGHTPLMVAAASATGGCSASNNECDTRCVDVLIALGADKTITNPTGDTALDMYRDAVSETNDFFSMAGLAHIHIEPGVEAKLYPA